MSSILSIHADRHAQHAVVDPAVSALWCSAMRQIASALREHQIHPSHAVVLLPYAQLIGRAEHAWAEVAAEGLGQACFLPRFETTMNWASSASGTLGFFTPAGDDLRMEVAFDTLTAASLLQRAGQSGHQEALAGRLTEAAWSLARVAAAQHPDQRAGWGAGLAAQLLEQLDSPVLALEALVGGIALAWVSNSAFATDRLFSAQPRFFAVIEGFQVEPLSRSLQLNAAVAGLTLPLLQPVDSAAAPPELTLLSQPMLHASRDAEDEAQRAAACIVGHLAAGRQPVALIAQDRLLTRRIGAMLAPLGVRIRDETGWKLSTTRAAADVMSLLRAAAWDASTDTVLDWLKCAPAWSDSQVGLAESELRKTGVRSWRALPDFTAAVAANSQALPLSPWQHTPALAASVNAQRRLLSGTRPLSAWLRALRAALVQSAQWAVLAADDAGQQLLDVLRLHEGAETEFDFAPSMALAAFTRWVDQALEGSSYAPAHPADEQVVLLPLAQLLGRAVAAVVFPGCDEVNLPMAPEPSGPWTPGQRALLGLPSRQDLSDANRNAWAYALERPYLEVLWRTSANGEAVMPSALVQTLLLARAIGLAADPRERRTVAVAPTVPPQPVGQRLPYNRLSASAYDDLRRCPYRFFALRQLRLKEADELESTLDKRDFGNWLHSTLSRFHDTLKTMSNPPTGHEHSALVTLLNSASRAATAALGLSDAEFLPFAAAWPQVRDGYLVWLAEHEATGARFTASEISRALPLGKLPSGAGLTLIGHLDRLDQVQASGDSTAQMLLIDYKTEPRTVTIERIKNGSEDIQLAFYAALMTEDTLAAAYVSVGEKEPTKTYAQGDIVALRDALIDGILSDMSRIADGAALPALGEGKVCNYCAARGLCRKDFWTVQ